MFLSILSAMNNYYGFGSGYLGYGFGQNCVSFRRSCTDFSLDRIKGNNTTSDKLFTYNTGRETPCYFRYGTSLDFSSPRYTNYAYTSPYTQSSFSSIGRYSYSENSSNPFSYEYTGPKTTSSTGIDDAKYGYAKPSIEPLKYNKEKGQLIIDYAKQYANKTQNEMRQIMTGSRYAFHTDLWCADFVSFITGKALGENNLPEWYRRCNRSYVPDIEKHARLNGAIVAERHGNYIDTRNVRPGNFVIINWQRDNSRVDHIGYVIKIEGNKVYTIEGNAGGKVSYNVRDLSLVHSFVDITQHA